MPVNSINELPFDEYCDDPDYHAVVTIKLCELVNDGFCDKVFSGWDWPSYNDEQDLRLRTKIMNHYWFREIALVPPGIFKHEFIRKMNEIMPKYIPLYRLMDESPELYGGGSEWYKGRDIYSDFPQTQLSGDNGDYASSGNDREFQRIKQADIIDTAKRLSDYNDIDLMIVNDMSSLFSCLFTVNTSSY